MVQILEMARKPCSGNSTVDVSLSEWKPSLVSTRVFHNFRGITIRGQTFNKSDRLQFAGKIDTYLLHTSSNICCIRGSLQYS